jgi:molecular chaperone GrpE
VTDDATVAKNEGQVAAVPAGLLLEAVRSLHAAMQDLAAQVANEHDRAKAREAVIDRLHEETQRLRAGEGRELLRPVLSDLRKLRDDLQGQARSVPGVMSNANVAALLDSYADSVELILERNGVMAVRPKPDAPFDPRRHRAAGIAAASEQGLDGMIATVLNDGYEDTQTGSVIAPARVIVYRHTGAGGPDGRDG